MNGDIRFSNALKERVTLLKAKKNHIQAVISTIRDRLTDSFINISKENIFANEFIYDDNNNIVSINDDNPLSKDKGKVEIAKKISGQNIIIGDGYTDYEVKKFGYAEKFIQFSENINRPTLNPFADYIAYNL